MGRRLVWFVGFSHATNHFVMLIFPAVLGLSVIFLALGMAAAAGVLLVVWFGSAVGVWSREGASSLPASRPGGR